jgi:hypothetical protein
MQRRQIISDELRYDHQTSPRKVRTFNGTSLGQPSLLYKDTMQVNDPKKWIGKTMIPWNGEIIQGYIRSVYLGKNDPDSISEYEIANYAKSRSYRILYVTKINGKLYLKSKPTVDYTPSRLNILLTTDNVIQLVAYF